MKRKCSACEGRGYILADNDVHGLRIERCDTCGRYTDEQAVAKAYEQAVIRAYEEGVLQAMTRRQRRPPALLRGYRENFNTLLRAAGQRDLALVSAIRKADQKPVALVCAMQRNEDFTIMPVPFAVMVEGNPFELFEDPTVDPKEQVKGG